MKKLILIVIMFLIPILSYSQEKIFTTADAANISESEYKYSIGAAAGFTTGTGVSFRKWFDNKKAVQITLLPFLNKENSTISLGLTYLQKLKQGKTTNLFFYTGYHYFQVIETSYIDDKNILNKKNTSINNNVGAGPGLEIKIDNIVFDIMVGFAIYHNNIDKLSLGLTGEIGLFYNF
ncbi:MAG: hypothetical protein ABIB46_06795 [bacterium]